MTPEDAIARASATFRAVTRSSDRLTAEAWWLLTHGWAVEELTIVECRVCNEAWMSPIGSTYPHFCVPRPPDRAFHTIPAVR